jgi:Tol biopolymer transport system component
LTLVLTALFAVPASATFPGQNGKIVYSSNLADPNGTARDLYRVNPDGTGVQRLTGLTAPFSDGDEDKPAVSADGKTIALVFEAEAAPGEDERYDIYLVNRDGTNPRLLVQGGSDPAWSPDGTRIAYTSISDQTGYQVGVMNADGSGQHLITPGDVNKASYGPDWSPDGTSIAFIRRRIDMPSVHTQIGTVHPDGSGRKLITAFTTKNAYDPYWSPDSRRIVFTAQAPDESEIWVMNRDGSSQQQLTDGHFDLHVTWSPNGSKLVFASERDVGFQLFTMPVAGGPITELTHPPAGAPQTLRQWRPYWDPTHPG